MSGEPATGPMAAALEPLGGIRGELGARRQTLWSKLVEQALGTAAEAGQRVTAA